MSKRTSEITDEEFGRALEALVAECTAGDLLAIPGVYELLAEEFNNEAIERVRDERETRARSGR